MTICLPREPRSAPQNQHVAAKRPSRVSEVLTQQKGGSVFWGRPQPWRAAWPRCTEQPPEARGASSCRPGRTWREQGGPLAQGSPSKLWPCQSWAETRPTRPTLAVWALGLATGSCPFLEVFGSQRVCFGWFAHDRLTDKWVVYCLEALLTLGGVVPAGLSGAQKPKHHIED